MEDLPDLHSVLDLNRSDGMRDAHREMVSSQEVGLVGWGESK